jgi:hypothetical protein
MQEYAVVNLGEATGYQMYQTVDRDGISEEGISASPLLDELVPTAR